MITKRIYREEVGDIDKNKYPHWNWVIYYSYELYGTRVRPDMVTKNWNASEKS